MIFLYGNFFSGSWLYGIIYSIKGMNFEGSSLALYIKFKKELNILFPQRRDLRKIFTNKI
jgi:hypothetical protein